MKSRAAGDGPAVLLLMVLLVVLVVLMDSSAAAGNTAEPGLFDGIARHEIESFSGWRLVLPAAAAGLTAAMVASGADFRLERFFHERSAWARPASSVPLLGQFVPVGVGAFLYFDGVWGDNPARRGAGCAVLQSLGLNLATVSLIKAVTGRPHPDPENHADTNRESRVFRWGFLRGGVFWGWPSGHVSAATTSVAALCAYYPGRTWLKVAGYSFVAFTAYGVTAHGGGSMHWASDAAAGALIGWAIGDATGRSFRRSTLADPAPAGSARIGVGAASTGVPVALLRIQL